MIDRLKTRMSSDEGFTLIELLVVIIILGILLAIAVPSYLSFKDRANKTAAAANVRSLIPSVESYNADNVPNAPFATDPDYNGSDAAGVGTNADTGYTGMTIAELTTKYDQAIPAGDYVWGTTEGGGVAAGTAPGNVTYCVYSIAGNWFAWKLNPQGTIQTSSAAGDVCKT